MSGNVVAVWCEIGAFAKRGLDAFPLCGTMLVVWKRELVEIGGHGRSESRQAALCKGSVQFSKQTNKKKCILLSTGSLALLSDSFLCR